ncbi:MAG: hypothetical protein QNJ07_05000 [Woeseiaceae bacterium]|nr:hypothetical protein [Woeseiaceae bacterium]
MNYRTFLAGLMTAAFLAVAACGDSDDERLAESGPDAAAVEGGIDLSDLPDDFPRELMPQEYDKADYHDLSSINGTRGTTFESSAHVQESIDYYIGLLGEPAISVESGDGDQMAQWRESPYPPWAVSVMGNAGETIVTVTTLPEQ